jgi:aryl-alcohol dehydrogenase-like predicted oxidoreductase
MTRAGIASLAEDDWRRRDANFQEPLLSRNLRLVQLLREIGVRHGRTPGEIAIAWTLANPAVTGAIVGMRNRDQVRGVIGAVDIILGAGELEEIELAWSHELAEKS